MPAYDLPVFPDVEVAVMDLLERDIPELEAGDVATATPADLDVRVAAGRFFVRVGLVTASDDRFTSTSVVDLDVFGARRQETRDLAERIRAFMLGYPHGVGTVTLDRVVTETAPFHAPWESENVHRRLATYRISTRR